MTQTQDSALRDYEPDEYGVWLPHGAPAASFDYSDGAEVESRMLANVQSLEDLSVLSPQLREFEVDWASAYHFSPRRANLLRPLAIRPGTTVLELGCGCGAITRYLGEIGCAVIAVEGSYARSRVAAERVRDLPNCRVICGDVHSLTTDQKFDIVVMVGVLEYAAVYDASERPYQQLLTLAENHLTDFGVLALAIENRFGLKYLAGSPEDHTGVPYFGVSDRYTEESARTFTQPELDALLHASGFNTTEYLTPLPDYKFVRAVIRPSAVPVPAWDTIGQLIATAFRGDAQISTVPPFSLEKAGYGIACPQLAISLANSFLVVAGRAANHVTAILDENDFAWTYATERALPFVKATVLSGRDEVIARCERLSNADPVPDSVIEQHLIDEPLKLGTSVWLKLAQAVNSDGWTIESVVSALRPLAELLASKSAADGKLPANLLDFTPFNAVERNGDIAAFDLEWSLKEPVQWSWVLLRGVYFSLNMLTSLAEPADDVVRATGPLAEQIVTRCLAPHAVPEVSLSEFVPWLISIQAAASGRDPESTRLLLTDQWDEPLRVRLPRRPERSSVYAQDDPLGQAIAAIVESMTAGDGQTIATEGRMEVAKALWTVLDVRAVERDALAADVDSERQWSAEMERRLDAEAAKVSELRAIVAALQGSSSWRYTKPLREAMGLLRSHLRAPDA